MVINLLQPEDFQLTECLSDEVQQHTSSKCLSDVLSKKVIACLF